MSDWVFGYHYMQWTAISERVLTGCETQRCKKPEGGILVTTGPYRIIRHPAYFAVCILGSLPGLILGSISGFIGMLTTTVLTVVYRTAAEEQLFEKKFGDHFIEYKRGTYRLFPFIIYETGLTFKISPPQWYHVGTGTIPIENRNKRAIERIAVLIKG